MMTGTDVLMRCTRCYRPVFNGSKNAEPDGTKLRPDGSARLKHRKCPERPELWRAAQ